MRIEQRNPVTMGRIQVGRAVHRLPGGEALVLREGERSLCLSARELQALRRAEAILEEARQKIRDLYGRDERGCAFCDYDRDYPDDVLGSAEAFLSRAIEDLEAGLVVQRSRGQGWEPRT